MADFATMLAQLLGQREEEQPNLAPTAPNTTPGTRGLFARRPVPMPQNMGMIDVQPMPIEQARNRQAAQVAPDRRGLGVRGWQQDQAGNWGFVPLNPPAPRLRPVVQTNPGAYANFAAYANAMDRRGLGGNPNVYEDFNPAPSLGAPGGNVEPPDAEFTLDPAYVQARGPVNYGADYPSRNTDHGIDPATGQRVIIGERLGPVRDRLTGQIMTPFTRQQMQDAPESVRRPINRQPPPAPFSIEDSAWAAAQERSRADQALQERQGAPMGDLVARLDRRSHPTLARNMRRR